MKRMQIDNINEQLDWLYDKNLDLYTRSIYLHTDDENGMDFREAAEFVKSINFLNSLGAAPITVYMQTCGGDWNYGMAIYDAIVNSESPVYIIGYGQIASIGAVILQAAAKRVLMPNCYLTIHFGE